MPAFESKRERVGMICRIDSRRSRFTLFRITARFAVFLPMVTPKERIPTGMWSRLDIADKESGPEVVRRPDRITLLNASWPFSGRTTMGGGFLSCEADGDTGAALCTATC